MYRFYCVHRPALRLTHLGLLFAAVFVVNFARAEDFVREMQRRAVQQRHASWGHWGAHPERYSTHTTHSNRLVPIYTFGCNLQGFRGADSIYRNEKRLSTLYGRLPGKTLNPAADYFDQTDVYQIQKRALAAGKKYIVLFVFDGLDWDTTRAAAVYKSRAAGYQKGRGQGLFFQDYRGVRTDFGYFVTSPHNEGTGVDVNAQTVNNPGGRRGGGYDPSQGGSSPWSAPGNPSYLLGQSAVAAASHVYADSASSATSMTAGIKTFNSAINVDSEGRKYATLAHRAQKSGYKVGAVTSVPISHATPAATYAHNVSRSDYQDLARDLLGLRSVAHREDPLPGLDVLIGAGFGVSKERDPGQGANYLPGNRYLADSDLAAIDARRGGRYEVALRTSGKSGTAVLKKAARVAIANQRRLLGFFGVSGGHLPFRTADGRFDPTSSAAAPAEKYTPDDVFENPILADMTAAALDVLSAGEAKFWLMVEPGDVDWAMHANNIDNTIGAIASGDEAFRVVTRWIEKNRAWDDAVVIVTSDHGHYFVLREPQAFVED